MPNVLPRCFWPQSTEQFGSTSSPFIYNIVVTRTDDYILSTQLNLFLQLNLSKSSVQLDGFTNWTRSVCQYPPKLPSGPSSKGTGSASLCHHHFTQERAPRAQQLWGWKLIVTAFSQNWGGSVPSFTEREWGTVSFVPWETEEGGKVV